MRIGWSGTDVSNHSFLNLISRQPRGRPMTCDSRICTIPVASSTEFSRCIAELGKTHAHSYSGIPFVATVFPKSAVAATYCREASDGFDPHHVFRHLVTELPLDTQPQWCAIRNRQRLLVHIIGENGLRMESIDQIDALVVRRARAHHIGAMKDQITRVRLQTDTLQQRAKLGAFPFPDGAPAFDAIVARDLRARR